MNRLALFLRPQPPVLLFGFQFHYDRQQHALFAFRTEIFVAFCAAKPSYL